MVMPLEKNFARSGSSQARWALPTLSASNAPLTPTGWLRLARCVVEDGWPLRRAAERFRTARSNDRQPRTS